MAGLKPDGSYDPDGFENTPLMVFVRSMTRYRLSQPPASVAIRIRASAHAQAFRPDDLSQWDTLTELHLWPKAKSSTSSSETVKRAGKALGHWSKDGLSWNP